MNAIEYLLPELQSSDRAKDINLTRRSMHTKSLESVRKRSDRTAKRFIPFAQERDQIGRLIKVFPGDSIDYQNNSVTSKSNANSALKPHIRVGNDTPDMSPIEISSTKNMLKLAENSVINRREQENNVSPSPGANYIDLSAHLYSIGRGAGNTLEVKSPKLRISPELTTDYQSDLTKSSHFEPSVRRETEADSLGRRETRSRLPPLHITKARSNGLASPANFSSMSSKNLRYKGVRDEVTVGQASIDSTESNINTSAWRFEATQMAQNKDVEKMLKKEKKVTTRTQKLVIPQKQDAVPPLGVYQPALSFVKNRTANCLILPEHGDQSPKTEHKHEECKKLHEVETRRKPVEVEENQSTEAYYKHLFKIMLQEANQKPKVAKKEDGIHKAAKSKGLDYILLEDFKKFPGDFEKKMIDMKRRLRVVKDKLKDYKEHE